MAYGKAPFSVWTGVAGDEIVCDIFGFKLY